MPRRQFICILALILLFIPASFAQSVNATTGSVGGKVTDNTAAALPGVTVTATNVETGLVRTAVTEGDGAYLLSLLPPGRYRVEAELAGLGKATNGNVVVLLGNNTKTDLSINPQLSQEITVTAAAPVIDVTRSGQTTSVTEKQIENLPILTRDFRALATLTPGVNEAFGGRVQSNGGRGITTDFNIDGANANSEFFGEQTGGTRAPFTFSQAAIREFQVIRSQYNAEYGRGVGATMNAITKSGTNDVDGEVFYFLRKKSWASSRPATINGLPATESFRARDSKQPGFAAGGPIARDKAFFFINADFQRQKLPIIANDFTTRTQFTSLPAATQAAFLQRFESVVGHPFAQEINYDQTFDQNTYLAKVDLNLGAKHHASIRDNYSDFHNANNQTGFQLLSNQGDEHDKFNQLVGQAESVFSNTLFNQLIAQYETQERPISPISEGYPEIVVTQGSATATFGNINFLPNNTKEKKYQLKDSLTWIMGQHTFKGGAEGLWEHFDNLFPRFARGQYSFASVQDFIDNKPNRFQQGNGPTGGDTIWNQATYGFFVQDSFKPFNKLSLDLGVRYDYQTMPTPTAAGAATKYPEFVNNWKEDKNNIAPRFGFAYDITGTGRSVLRGGTGKFFNYLPSILLANPLAQISGGFTFIDLRCSNTVQCPTFPNILTPTQFASQPPSGTAIQVISNNFQAQESWRSSMQFEQQIGQQYSVGIGGEYAKLKHVQGKTQLNATPLPYTFGNLPVYTVNATNRPYKDYASVLADFSNEEASNKSFTIETHKLALQGSKISWDAHYTWSKSTDQESNERSTSTTFLFDPFNPRLSEGAADFDVRHRVVLDATYELPFGVFVSGIFNWRSGAPYTQNIFCNCGGLSLNGLPNVSGNIPVFLDQNNEIIDLTAASGMTRPQFANFLSAYGAHIDDRNGARQPNVMNFDARLSKRFGLPRGMEIELIGEVFNLFNRRNTFVTATNQSLFTANYTASTDKFTFTRNAQYGIATSYNTAVDPRQIQVAAKFRF